MPAIIRLERLIQQTFLLPQPTQLIMKMTMLFLPDSFYLKMGTIFYYKGEMSSYYNNG